jgi:hypothetical protein
MIERLVPHHFLPIDRDRARHIGLRLLIILAVLLLSAALSLKFPANRLKLVLLLPFGMVALGALLRWPPLGLVILGFGGMVIPFEGPNNLNITVLLSALLLALWLQDIIILKRQRSLASSRTILPLALFIGVSFLAFGSGQIKWFSFVQNAPLDAQLGGLAIFVLSAGIFLLVGDQIKDLRWLQWMTWSFVALGAIYIAGRVIPGGSQITRNIIQGHTVGGMFWAWLAPIAFSQAVFNRDLDKGWRVALMLLVAASFYSGYFQASGWKSSWVPPLAAVAAIVAIRSWRLGLLLAIAGYIPAVILASNALSEDEYSVSTRLEAWEILGEIIKVNPALGVGFGNYYWYTPLFRIRGFEVSFNSHNNYVDLVAQTGLVGLFCCLWFFLEVGRLGWYLRDRVPAGFAQAYVYGALGGLVGTLVAATLGDWMLPFVYNIGLSGFRTGILCWLFLGGLVALEQMLKEGSFDLGNKPDRF